MSKKNKSNNRAKKIKIKKGDEVIVCRGKNKGTKESPTIGKVIKVDYKRQVVYVSGVNLIKKHVRPRGKTIKGGIIEKEGPIHISNVMLVDPKTKKPTRIAIKREEDGTFTRIAKKSGTPVK